MALSVFKKLSTGAALIGINTSREPIFSFLSSWFKRNQLGFCYSRTVPMARVLARREIRPMLLWQEGGKLGSSWKGGKAEASAGQGWAARTGKREGAALQDKGIKFGRAVRIPAQTCSRNDLSALDRVTANVGAILGWFSFVQYRKYQRWIH